VVDGSVIVSLRKAVRSPGDPCRRAAPGSHPGDPNLSLSVTNPSADQTTWSRQMWALDRP
jgi:hypothetical protein